MKIRLSIAIAFISVCTMAQTISTNDYKLKTSKEDFNLQGNVKEVIVKTTDAKGNWSTLPFGDSEYFNQYTLNFNPKGNLIKQTNYLEYQGKLGVYNFVENTYNTHQNLINQVLTIVNNGEDPIRIASQKTFQYNSKNQVIRIDELLKGKNSSSTYQTEFIYHDRLDEVITKVDQVKSSSNHYTYNKKGNVVKVETVSFDGKSGLKKFFIYDGKLPVYQEENINNRKVMAYYHQGKMNTYKVYNAKQELDMQFNYNAKNEIVGFKKSAFVQGKPELEDYQVNYTYDSKENWTKAEIFSNNTLKYIVIRDIQYY